MRKLSFRSHNFNPQKKQAGAALLLFILLLVVGATTMLVSKMNKAATQYYRDDVTMRALNEAKEALMGWAISHPDQPGLLPFPDRITAGETTNPYDGFSDCTTHSNIGDDLILGKVPWRGQRPPCRGATSIPGMLTNHRDPGGEILWYAVSKNLLASDAFPPIGPDLLEETSDWITVLDQTGNPISDRVAFVLIAPGETLSYQDRSGGSPTASQFLDRVTVGGTTYSNADTASNIDFIIYPNSKNTPVTTDEFNDVLVFVTIEELINSVAKRAMGEISNILSIYQRTNATLPWLSTYSDPTDSSTTFFDGIPGERQGHLPIHLTSETFDISTPGSFSAVWNISDGSSSPSGTVSETCLRNLICDPIFDSAPLQGQTCEWTNKDEIDCTATKTGTGGETRTYTINYTTNAIANLPTPVLPDWVRLRQFDLTTTPPLVATIEIVDTSGGSETGRGTLDFSSVSGGPSNSFDLSVIYDLDQTEDEIPEWFIDSNWHHYFYIAYASGDNPPGAQLSTCVSSVDCLTLNTYAATSAGAGVPENIGDFRALILFSGRELLTQDRTDGSAPITDYFEGHDTTQSPNENINGNDVFDALIQADVNFNDEVRVAYTCTADLNKLCWIP